MLANQYLHVHKVSVQMVIHRLSELQLFDIYKNDLNHPKKVKIKTSLDSHMYKKLSKLPTECHRNVATSAMPTSNISQYIATLDITAITQPLEDS